MRLLSPALYFASLLGLLLSAISMVLDQPVASLIDSSLHSLPGVLHAMGFLPGTVPPEGVVVPPLVRSLLLVPLRMPSTMLLSFFLYLLCVPGFDVLVRARTGFEHGFRAVASGGTSNAPGGGDSDERLASVLATWGRVISVVRAARFAAFGIVALALVDRLPEMVKAGAPLATSACRWLQLLLLAGYVLRRRDTLRASLPPPPPSPAILCRARERRALLASLGAFMRLGVPGALMLGLEAWSS